MKLFTFDAEQSFAHPVETVFGFFADAFNLEKITPPWLRFRVVTPPPIVMGAGTMIDYRIRLHGFPMRWRSEITAWDPPHCFIDEQRRGPYRFWKHLHTFEVRDGMTVVRDHVDYAVPGGAVVNRIFVRRSLERIFAYRTQAMAAQFR